MYVSEDVVLFEWVSGMVGNSDYQTQNILYKTPVDRFVKKQQQQEEQKQSTHPTN